MPTLAGSFLHVHLYTSPNDYGIPLHAHVTQSIMPPPPLHALMHACHPQPSHPADCMHLILILRPSGAPHSHACHHQWWLCGRARLNFLRLHRWLAAWHNLLLHGLACVAGMGPAESAPPIEAVHGCCMLACLSDVFAGSTCTCMHPS